MAKYDSLEAVVAELEALKSQLSDMKSKADISSKSLSSVEFLKSEISKLKDVDKRGKIESSDDASNKEQSGIKLNSLYSKEQAKNVLMDGLPSSVPSMPDNGSLNGKIALGPSMFGGGSLGTKLAGDMIFNKATDLTGKIDSRPSESIMGESRKTQDSNDFRKMEFNLTEEEKEKYAPVKKELPREYQSDESPENINQRLNSITEDINKVDLKIQALQTDNIDASRILFNAIYSPQ